MGLTVAVTEEPCDGKRSMMIVCTQVIAATMENPTGIPVIILISGPFLSSALTEELQYKRHSNAGMRLQRPSISNYAHREQYDPNMLGPEAGFLNRKFVVRGCGRYCV